MRPSSLENPVHAAIVTVLADQPMSLSGILQNLPGYSKGVVAHAIRELEAQHVLVPSRFEDDILYTLE